MNFIKRIWKGITSNISEGEKDHPKSYYKNKPYEGEQKFLEQEQIEKDNNEEPTSPQPEEEIAPSYKYTINTDTIPVIDKSSERKFNEPYKESDDGDNVIRYIQKAPKGLGKKLFEFVSVVGTSRYREDIFKTITSDNYEIRLEKEPDNQFDKNAVKVMSDCKINGEEKSFRVGYLPKEIAKKLSNYENIGVTLKTLYIPTAEKSPGFRLDIWTERAKRKTKADEKPYTSEINIPSNRQEALIRAEELEKDGYIDNAIEVYEKCIKQDINFYLPYKRLCIIYRRRKQYEKELIIIDKGLSKFKNNKSISDDLKKRLKRTKQLKDNLSK